MKKLILLSLLLLSVSLFGCAAKKSPQESSQASLQPQSQTPEDGDTPNDSSPTTTGEAEEPDVYSEVISLEGMNETVFYQKIAGSFGYRIPMDVDRFTFEAGETADRFFSMTNEHIYMTIAYEADTTAAEIAQMEIPAGVTAETGTALLGSYEATVVHLRYGDEPDSPITDLYFIEHGGGVYKISHVYFLEAAEGFGARMLYMTQGFEIG